MFQQVCKVLDFMFVGSFQAAFLSSAGHQLNCFSTEYLSHQYSDVELAAKTSVS